MNTDLKGNGKFLQVKTSDQIGNDTNPWLRLYQSWTFM